MPHTPHTEQKKKTDRRVIIAAAFILVVVGGGIGVAAYIAAAQKTVYIENSTIEAPVVDLTPTTAGTLSAVYVSVGDTIAPNTVVAEVGTDLIKSQNGGYVIMASNAVGKPVGTSDTIVKTIDPSQLRVVGQVEEDKGLADIVPGQRATFTVDAFGGESFDGIVDEVEPTANNSDVVFNISDKRQEQDFDIKVRFDVAAHPELKNGMSAKLWIYKN